MGKSGKCYVLASTPKLREALGPVMKRRGIKVQSTGVYLGVDMPTSRGAPKRKRARRTQALHERTGRLHGLRKQGKRMAKGVVKVFSAGLKPSCIYGAKCLGLNDGQLLALRRSAGKAYGGGLQRLFAHLAVGGRGQAL